MQQHRTGEGEGECYSFGAGQKPTGVGTEDRGVGTEDRGADENRRCEREVVDTTVQGTVRQDGGRHEADAFKIHWFKANIRVVGSTRGCCLQRGAR